MNPDHFFLDALTIAGGFGAVALGILATTRAQEWRDARRKRRQEAEFKLAAAENVRLAAKTLTGGKEIHDRYLDPVGGFKGESLVGRRFEVAVPPEPTVDERLKVLERAKVESEGSFKWLNDHGLERREFEKRSKECLVEHRELIERTAERVTKLEAKLEKLHESLVSHARDIDRLDGRIDTLAKRRAPKNRAR